MWKGEVKAPGRTAEDYVSFIDLAPTFVAVAGVAWERTGMAPPQGRSLTDILFAAKGGRVNPARDHVLVGRERNDVGRPHDEGYPVRGIVKDGWLYLHNFEPSRWPACNPETGYLDVDGSPTKTEVLKEGIKQQLFNELRAQEDPRVLGKGHIFDEYRSADVKMRGFYERYRAGGKIRAGWVNESDFEKGVEK